MRADNVGSSISWNGKEGKERERERDKDKQYSTGQRGVQTTVATVHVHEAKVNNALIGFYR